jgi:hypothetical protein
VSRTLGTVAGSALPPDLAGALPAGVPTFDLKSVYDGATLLGFPLFSLLKLPPNPLATLTDSTPPPLPVPPQMVQLIEGGVPTGMTMRWTLDLDAHGPFIPSDHTKLVLTVQCSTTTREITCTVNDFTVALPPGGGSLSGLLTLSFTAVTFTQTQGSPPHLKLGGPKIDFGGALKLLEDLQKKLSEVIDLPDALPVMQARKNGVTASYALTVPQVAAGAFLIRNVAMRTAVDIPFDGKPVTVSLGFATRDNPFTVSVLAFGGGGYIDVTLGPAGLLSLEASIEFGAAIAVDFLIARGEVHALGGVRFTGAANTIDIDGYLRIGGSVEVLGLVSVSIELLVSLTYRGADNSLVGRASIVVEIDLTLYSDRVEIDSGDWVLAGGTHALGQPRNAGAAVGDDPAALQAWIDYRKAFALA